MTRGTQEQKLNTKMKIDGGRTKIAESLKNKNNQNQEQQQSKNIKPKTQTLDHETHYHDNYDR